MRKLKIAIYFLSAVTILLPAACSAPVAAPAPTIIPVALPTTTLVPSPTISPSATSPRPTDTPEPTSTSSPTAIAKNVRVKQISSGYIGGAMWSADGKIIYYTIDSNTSSSGPRENYKWFTYKVETGEISDAPPLSASNIDTLKRLKADNDFIKSRAWFRGLLSPSGQKIAYLSSLGIPTPPRPSPDTYTTYLWVANYDGSNPKKLGFCGSLHSMTWFDQERKILAQCRTIGPPSYLIGDLIKNNLVPLTDATSYTKGFAYFDGSTYALSPDEKILAVTINVEVVDPQKHQEPRFVLISLDKNPFQVISDYGFSPNWSQDSKRLYYLKAADPYSVLECGTIYLYDRNAKTNVVLLEFPLATLNGYKIKSIFCEAGGFTISPLENAALFYDSDKFWIAEWSK